MPTKNSRARRWVKEGKAIGKWSDVGIYYVQLLEPAGEETQPVVVGLDPGKSYAGVGVQSTKFLPVLVQSEEVKNTDSFVANYILRFPINREQESVKAEQSHPLVSELMTWLKLQNLKKSISDTLEDLPIQINPKMSQSTAIRGNELVSLHQAK
jgi:hypothetical protein